MATAQSGEGNDVTWYPNSSATTHMTPIEDILSTKSTYRDTSSVVVGNGTKLSISHIWHTRLGHCGSRAFDMLKHKDFIIPESKFSNKCIACKMGKARRLPFTSVEHCFSTLLYLIHSDVWQSPISSNLGYHYYMCFVDDCTCYTWIYPMKYKSKVHSIFVTFQKMAENLFDRKI